MLFRSLSPRDGSEPVYIFDSESEIYRLLDDATRDEILEGRLRI